MLNIQSFEDTPSTNWERASKTLEALTQSISSNVRLLSPERLRGLHALNDRFAQGERTNELYEAIMKFATEASGRKA